MIKAAFFDIDGTLLSFKTHKVSEGTKRAFARLHSVGIRTFLSSGRPQCLIPAMPLHFDAHITMNGALVYTPTETLISHPIPKSDTEAWLDIARRKRLCTMIFERDSMIATQLNDTGLRLREQLAFPMPPVVDIDQIEDIVAYQIIALMPSEMDAAVAAVMPGCRMPRWHPAFTDIVAMGNDKSKGMAAVCDHFNIDQADTIAFGDGANDIEMLQWAGIGIAMGNADPTVKESADMVTTDVDHEGIENAIDKLLR